MKIFVINLARRTDRLANIRRQLDDFERVEAVDGSDWKKTTTSQVGGRKTGVGRDGEVARFRFWCAKGYGVLPGEIGCAMSHQMVYRKMVDDGIGVACVLEDDVTLRPGFLERIEEFGKILHPDVPEVLTFGVTAAGYLINRRGAELMLRLNMPIRSTADDWWRWERGGLHWQKVDGVLTVPKYGNPAAEGVAKSDIIGDARHLVSRKPWCGRVVYKLTRVFGKTIDWWLER